VAQVFIQKHRERAIYQKIASALAIFSPEAVKLSRSQDVVRHGEGDMTAERSCPSNSCPKPS
jgi:hypothetical protein